MEKIFRLYIVACSDNFYLCFGIYVWTLRCVFFHCLLIDSDVYEFDCFAESSRVLLGGIVASSRTKCNVCRASRLCSMLSPRLLWTDI